jgi:hypothetical protein
MKFVIKCPAARDGNGHDYFSGEIMPGKTVRYRGTLRYACSNPFARFT